MSIFKLAPIPQELDPVQSMGRVARTYGIGYWRQAAQLARLMPGPTWIKLQDYYKLALFRPMVAPIAASQYLGEKGGSRLNVALSPPATGHWALLANKLLTGLVLNGSGFRTPRILAVYSATGPVPGQPSMSSAADLVQYLRAVDLPIFGKPMGGPLISEMNTTPFHMLYQRAADRGEMNPDFAPRFAEAQAATTARIALRARSATRGAERKARR